MAAIPPGGGAPYSQPSNPPRVGRGQPLNKAQSKAAPVGRGKPLNQIRSKVLPQQEQSITSISGTKVRVGRRLDKAALLLDKIDFTKSIAPFFIQFDNLIRIDQTYIKNVIKDLIKNFDKDGDFESTSSKVLLGKLVSEPVTSEKLKRAQQIVVSIRPYFEDAKKLQEKIKLSSYEVTLAEEKEKVPRYAEKLNLAHKACGAEWRDDQPKEEISIQTGRGIEHIFFVIKNEENKFTKDELNNLIETVEHFHKVAHDPIFYSKSELKKVINKLDAIKHPSKAELSKLKSLKERFNKIDDSYSKEEYLKDIVKPLLVGDTNAEFKIISRILRKIDIDDFRDAVAYASFMSSRSVTQDPPSS